MNSSSPCTVGFTKIGAFGGKLEKMCKNLHYILRSYIIFEIYHLHNVIKFFKICL